MVNSHEILIPPSKEDALESFDSDSTSNNNSSNKDFFKSKDSKELFSNSNNNNFSNSNNESNSYDEHYLTWKKKYEEGKVDMSLTSLQKIDTRGVPNNLFEMKQKSLNEQYSKNDYNRDNNRFASISSDPDFKDTMNYNGEDPGMIGTFGSLVGSAFSRTKEVLSNVKEKYTEYEVTDKLKTTGETTLGILKYTGSTIHSIATSDTTKQILGKTKENIGYLFNRLFYGQGNESNSNSNSHNVDEDKLNSGLEYDNSGYTSKKSYNRYSPPKKSVTEEDDLSETILFKKDSNKYSSKSYMS